MDPININTTKFKKIGAHNYPPCAGSVFGNILLFILMKVFYGRQDISYCSPLSIVLSCILKQPVRSFQI